MENFILTIKTKELEEKSGELGFSKTLFFGTDFVVLEGTNKKDILLNIQKAKGKKQQDKRASLKERDWNREKHRLLKR